MNTILFNFNVHIQALNIHPLASFAPLREFFLADIFCVIYISRQAAKVARRYSEFILAPLTPLREHNTSCARTITSCEIVFPPSRQDLCSCRLMTTIHPEQRQAKAIYLFFSRYFSERLTSSAKPISLRRFLEDKWISIHSFSEKWYPHALASSTICLR